MVIKLINQERLVAKFIELAKVDTMSQPGASSFPSSEGQKILALTLVEQLKNMGLEKVEVDQYYVVTALLPANINSAPTIGLLAHVDTSCDAPSCNVQPKIHTNYQQGDIILQDGIIINEKDLMPFVGHDIITTDGLTLLGADDKAGIAEILETLHVFIENPQLKRPNIKVAFTPDEETGEYIHLFDVDKFAAYAAYTIDSQAGHCVDTATFNAYNVTLIVKGYNVHTGESKNKLVNANKIVRDIINLLPEEESPEQTEGLEGFYHVHDISCNTAEGTIKFLLRDYDIDKLEERLQKLINIVEQVVKSRPKGKASYEIKPVLLYQNTKEFLDKCPEIVQNALEGISRTYKELGINKIPKENSIRGGTDGSTLSANGLPTANLEAGTVNAHAKNEFISVQKLVECTANIVNTMIVWVEKAKQNQ